MSRDKVVLWSAVIAKESDVTECIAHRDEEQKQGNVIHNFGNKGPKVSEKVGEGEGAGNPNSTRLWSLGTKDARLGKEAGKRGNILAGLLRAVLTWSDPGAAHLRGSGRLAPWRPMATVIAPACSCVRRKRKFSTLSLRSRKFQLFHIFSLF